MATKCKERERKLSTRSSQVNSVQIPIEFNVKPQQTTCCSLCRTDLFISCILFFSDVCFALFLLFQWAHRQYYLAILIVLVFMLLSNLCNLYQWYSFTASTTFKWCHLIVFFGLIGCLPLFSVIYYLCHSSCCCVSIAAFTDKDYLTLTHNHSSSRRQNVSHSQLSYRHTAYIRSKSRKPKSYKTTTSKLSSNDHTELLLPVSPSSFSVDGQETLIHEELLCNITQLLIVQCFVRTLPSICVELFVWITADLSANHWFLTTGSQMRSVSDLTAKYDSYLIDDLRTYYVLTIALGLVTYSFITVNYLDMIQTWQYQAFPMMLNRFFQCTQILFVISDFLIRTVPLILVLTCHEIRWYFLAFGFQILWSCEVLLWYRIYEYFPDFPLKKVYPFTFTAIAEDHEDGVESTRITQIAMEPATHSLVDHDDIERDVSLPPKEYQSPPYVTNRDAESNEDVLMSLSPTQTEDEDEDRAPDLSERAGNLTRNNKGREHAQSRPVLFVPASMHKVPGYGLVLDEYMAFGYGLLGGTLTCFSGWLIGQSLRCSVRSKHYKWSVVELLLRYLCSILLMVIYCELRIEHILGLDAVDRPYWIWLAVFVVCLVLVLPFLIVVYLVFRPNTRDQRIRSFRK